MHKKSAFLAAALSSIAHGSVPLQMRKPHPKRAKLCLYCGKPHTHNNSWCSSDCAKAWKARKKAG